MTDNNSVIREKRGQAFWITINRPDKRNAINADVVAGIARGYRDAHDDKDVRVIVLTGRGRQGVLRRRRPAEQRRRLRDGFSRPNVDYADLLRLSQNATKPAIARVGASAWPAAWAAVHDRHGGRRRPRDLRIARGEGRRVPDAGDEPVAIDGAAAPRQRVGADRRAVRRHGAQAAGLLNYVVPSAELDAKVDWLIGRIVDKSPTAIRRGKYRHARDRLDVVRRKHCVHRKPDCLIGNVFEDAKEGRRLSARNASRHGPAVIGCPPRSIADRKRRQSTAQVSREAGQRLLWPQGKSGRQPRRRRRRWGAADREG